MPPKEKDNTQKLIRPQAVQYLLESLEGDKIFGEVLIKVKDGRIVQISVSKSYVDESQLYENY